MKKISFILLLACLGFFAACSDDHKDPVPPAERDYAKEIVSTYVGKLTVTAPIDANSDPVTEVTERGIEIKYRGLNSIDLSLKDFVFLQSIIIPEVLLEDIKVEGSDKEVKIVAKDFANYDLAGMENITIKVKGNNVVDYAIDLDLEILVPGFEKPITVLFKGGKKNVFDFENWDESKKYSTPITTGVPWASSNNGLNLVASKIPYFPIQPTDITPSGSGKAALIETMNTKGIMAMVPAITAGSLFTGTFNTLAALGGPLKATEFTGYAFEGKPVEMSVYYKYIPGEVFYRSSYDGRADATPEEGTKDQCAINAILYDITDDSKTKITGDKPYDDARIIAKAMFTGDKQESYIQKSIKFEFSKAFDASRKYRLAIITTSSAGGDTFSGAPGSKLYLDNIEIITE